MAVFIGQKEFYQTLTKKSFWKFLWRLITHYVSWTELLISFKRVKLKKWGSEFSSYEIELPNGVTQNDVTFRVTNSKIFIEILLSSY